MSADSFCTRCNCCSAGWEDCDYCGGEGLSSHDCGEDCCCCLEPELNVRCEMCRGRGSFKVCLGNCDSDGKHVKVTVSTGK